METDSFYLSASSLQDICELISRALKNPDIRYHNTQLKKCWEIKACGNNDCVAYNNKNLRCWQLAGTYCGRAVQGSFVEKYDDCKQCEVFSACCENGMDLIGEHFNNLVHLVQIERTKKDSLNAKLKKALHSLGQKNREITRLMVTDNLTSLYNRHYLFNTLEKELARAKRYRHALSLLIIDVDDLKGYNDFYGHWAGDILLKKMGAVINNSVRNSDIPCRFGGDEFVVILPETDQQTALILAERIRQTLKSNFPHPATKKRTLLAARTTSIGICTVQKNYDTLQHIFEHADTAMYRAKQEGGDKIRTFYL